MLNRVLRWTEQSAEYEADPRQVERLLEEIELDGDGVKGVATPGQQPRQHQVADENELPEEQHTRFRGFAARELLGSRPHRHRILGKVGGLWPCPQT